MAKETLTTKVATLTERVSNLIESNREFKEQMFLKIDNLSSRVNHQFTNLEKRTKWLENKQLIEISKYKGRMELFKWTSIVLSILLSTVSISQIFNLI